jgi:hypothetical protein
MKVDEHIALSDFPENRKYYTPTYPAALYKYFFLDAAAIREGISRKRIFYYIPQRINLGWCRRPDFNSDFDALERADVLRYQQGKIR